MSKKVGVTTAVGIHLGTTYSYVAAWFGNHYRVEIIPNKQGNKLTPSCVAWDGRKLLVGHHAVTRKSKSTIFDCKCLMGSGVQKDIELWPFKITEGSEEKPMLVIERKSGSKQDFSYEEVYSMIVKNLKEAAEAYLGATVTHAVITVPQHFSDKQQQITKDASKLAGLNVMRVITEPKSAAVSYVLDKSLDLYCPVEKTVFVFDISGRTFNVSLLHINKAGTIDSVESVGGDTHLGWEDFDKLMVKHCVQVFRNKENKDVTENEKAMIRLNVACEEAKRDLLSTTQTSIEIDSLIDGIDFSMKFSKENFEELKVRFLNECIENVKNCLKDGKMHKKDVDDVVIVGGSKQNISMVQQMLMEFLDGKPIFKSVNADEAVARGAALLAARLTGKDNRIIEIVRSKNTFKKLIKKIQNKA